MKRPSTKTKGVPVTIDDGRHGRLIDRSIGGYGTILLDRPMPSGRDQVIVSLERVTPGRRTSPRRESALL